MYLSAKKYLEESAKSATSGADQLIRHTSVIINTVKVYEKCHRCNAQVSALNNYLTSQNTCRMCCKFFCSNCIGKTAVNVPNHYLDITFQNKTAHAQPERQYLCLHRCTPRVINACMHAFRKEITSRFEEYVNLFLSDEQKQHFFFNIPEASPEDTAYRKALRMIHIAGVVAGMTGYAMTYNAVKYAYYSSELVNILTEGGILGILTPLLESLKECGIGITGPTAMMRLYYLGCYHTLQSKIDNSRRSLLYESHLPGVIYSECPLAVLEYVNSYLSAAQWMYLSCLPPPHQDNDWGSWYLSQIIRRQGWSLLMCINDSTKIPDGSKCPAFALVTRCFPMPASDNDSTSSPSLVKEAMLVIRGSSTVMDWSINLEDEMCEYAYTHILDYDITSHGFSGDTCGYTGVDATTGRINTSRTQSTSEYLYTSTVQGIIHKGLYTAAMGLLEGYNLRATLLRLVAAGYSVKIVGHSLGAGIAALIAAELRISLIVQHLQSCEESATFNTTQDNTNSSTSSTRLPDVAEPTSPSATRLGLARPESGLSVHSSLVNTISTVSAVVFSSPAFLSLNLADAFLVDRLLINVVYDKDIIPRFSFKTIQVMAEELKDPDFCAQADKWTLQDKSDFSDYAVSMGKAADIHKPVYGEASVASAAEAVEEGVTVSEAGSPTPASSTTAATATSPAVPAKPSKPPKSEKPSSISAKVTATDTTNTPATTTTTSTSNNAPTTAPSSATSSETTTTAATKGTSSWGGFMSSLAATALDKYQQVQTQQQQQTQSTATAPTAAPTAPVGSLSDASDVADAPRDTASDSDKVDPQVQFAEQTAHAVSSSSSAEVTQKAPRAHTVTPGPIVHLYKENDGTVHGAVVTHLHSSFQRMEIIPAHSADDHLMAKVREGMKSALFQHQLLTHSGYTSGSKSTKSSGVHHHKALHTRNTTSNPSDNNNNTDMCDLPQEAQDEVNSTTEERVKFDTYFNIPLSKNNSVYQYAPAAGSGPHSYGTAAIDGTASGSSNVTTSGGNIDSGVGEGKGGKMSGSMPGLPAKVHRSISSEGQQIPGLHNNNISASASATSSTAVVVDGNPTKSSISMKGGYSSSGTSKKETVGGNSSKQGGTTPPNVTIPNAASVHGNVGLAAQQWVNCSVCSLDVTWPYVLHSDASRAIVAHNCRKCGDVVCSMCAPAGDTLPGDGLNQSYKLQDYRVSLPERGLFSPQRVCVLCYFDT